jgi:5'-3' exoribonuclease 2
LPSLDIRDGALDYLFNVYKRVLPSLGDYITNHGGQVNLSHVDVILAEVGSIEDYVFTMKYDNERREKERRDQNNARTKQANGRSLDAPPTTPTIQPKPKATGRAGKILEKHQEKEVPVKKQGEGKIKSSHMKSKENLQAALALKESLNSAKSKSDEIYETAVHLSESEVIVQEQAEDVYKNSDLKIEAVKEEKEFFQDEDSGVKRKLEDAESGSGVGVVGAAEEEFDDDEDGDEDEDLESIPIEIPEAISPEVAATFKNRVKDEQKKKLDEYAKTVDDKVRLHEIGWKDRYYTDKCKADDVANHGGREHLFKSYIMGLCWVMKYYYEGCKLISSTLCVRTVPLRMYCSPESLRIRSQLEMVLSISLCTFCI